MASKRKDAVALFEAISKTKPRPDANMNVPAWMQKQGDAQAAQGQTPVAPQTPGSTQPQAGTPAVSEQALTPVPAVPAVEVRSRPEAVVAGGADEPVFSTVGGRLKLAMDYRTAGFVGAGAVVLLIVAFVLGRVSGPRPAATDANVPPMKPDVVQPGNKPGTTRAVVREQPLPPPAGAAALAPATPQRVKGKFYIVIQGMAGKTDALKEEAFRIADFCTKHNLPADVAELGSRSFIVWSLQPFDSASDPQAKKYAEEIEKVGKLYKAAGGKYDFMQRKTHNGPLDPMLKQQP